MYLECWSVQRRSFFHSAHHEYAEYADIIIDRQSKSYADDNDKRRVARQGRGSFGHGSIGHHQPQRPVFRGFPLFKRCEWLVFNRFVSKRRPPARQECRSLSETKEARKIRREQLLMENEFYEEAEGPLYGLGIAD